MTGFTLTSAGISELSKFYYSYFEIGSALRFTKTGNGSLFFFPVPVYPSLASPQEYN